MMGDEIAPLWCTLSGSDLVLWKAQQLSWNLITGVQGFDVGHSKGSAVSTSMQADSCSSLLAIT